MWRIPYLKVSGPSRSFFFFLIFRVISIISVVLKEITFTTSVSTGEPVSIESEIMKVVSPCTTKISEIT